MISIIGGSGFIGTRLSRRLFSENKEFEIIDLRIGSSFPEKTHIADVRDPLQLGQTVNGEVIINLAAEHRDDISPKSLYDEVNVHGAKHVCEVAELKGIKKIIFTSSVAVYGFAPIGTDESGDIAYFNDYGRTKYEAEQIYRAWHAKDPGNRSLVIIRPTVVFGEQNRGNVFNLLQQIASGRFIMVGDGKNIKSMAYVENVAAFLEHSLDLPNGLHLYNYVDKPDFNMNVLVQEVYKNLAKPAKIKFRLPYKMGYAAGKVFDFVAAISGRKFPISSIRVKKFCGNTSFNTAVHESGFKPPVPLVEGLSRTIQYEFVEKKEGEIFYTE